MPDGTVKIPPGVIIKNVVRSCAAWISRLLGLDLSTEDPCHVLVLIEIAFGFGLLSSNDLFGLLFSKNNTEPEAVGVSEPKDLGDETVEVHAGDDIVPGVGGGDKKGLDSKANPVDENAKKSTGNGNAGNGKKGLDGKANPVDENAKKSTGDGVDDEEKAGEGNAKQEEGPAKKQPSGDLNEEKRKRRLQELEWLMLRRAWSVHVQSDQQDRRQILLDTEALILKDKYADLDRKLQDMAAERHELDKKIEGVKSAEADLEKREAVIKKDKEELDLGLKEVAAGKEQVSCDQKRVAGELAAVEKEKYNLFLERRTLQDLVKASEAKKRSETVVFLKWLASRPRVLHHATTPLVEWTSLAAALLATGGFVLSGKSPKELWDIGVNMAFNEFKDAVDRWAAKIDKAEKQVKEKDEKKQDGDGEDGKSEEEE